MPRGLKSFVVRDGVLALKPVNDTELLSISFTLPAGFGYVLAEVHLNIEQDRAADWESSGLLLLSNIDSAHADMSYRQPLGFVSVSNGGTALDVRATRLNSGTLSRIPIFPAQSGVFTSLRFSNLTATAAAAGNVNAVCSFWEYDLEQLVYFAAHMATNVVGR